jgi:site-specific DNA-methyltransferase (adenine-specific)
MGLAPQVEVASPPIRLYQVDCLDGMARLLAPQSVSVVVTSPPYNIGIPYRSYDDRRPRDEYLAWIGEVARSVARVLEPEGSFFLNIGGRPADPWIPWDVAARVREWFVLQNVIHWIKAIAIDKQDVGAYPGITRDVAVGHYKPITSARYLHDCHEYIFHFTRSGRVALDRLAVGVPYQDKTNIGRWQRATRDLRCRGNTWFMPYVTIRDRARQRPHPSSFPIQLPERCLKLHGLSRIKLVLDPFMGIGTTALAARRLNLPCVGFETDAYYLEVARRRLVEERSVRPEPLATQGSSTRSGRRG